MSFNDRHSRSPHSHVKQVLDRLLREAGTGKRAIASFAAICDMLSIPRDLRASLLEQLVREGYVTLEGDKLIVTEAGKQLATAPVADAPNTTPNPSPLDSASRVRTPHSGRRD